MIGKKNLLYYFCFACMIFFLALGLFSFTKFSDFIINIIESNYLHRSFIKAFLWKGRIRTLFFLISGLFGIIYFFLNDIGKGCLSDYRVAFSKIKCLILENKCIVIIFSIIIFFVFFPIISFAVPFQDDFGRNFNGHRGWGLVDSRVLSEILSILVHQNFKLPQIAPLPQFISLALLLIGTIELSIALTGQISFFSLITSSLIFVTPFFIGNFSYQYDAPYMTLAIDCVIFPFVLLSIDKKKSFCINSVIFLIAACMLYQAAINVYLVLSGFIFWKKFISKTDEKSFSFLGYAVLALIIVLVSYKCVFSFPIENKNNRYYSVVLDSNFLISVFNNIKSFIKYSLLYYGNSFSKFLFICGIFVFIFESVRHSKINAFVTIIFSILGLSIVYILSFGFYLAFSKTLFSPRAFMGFNVIMPCLFLLFSCEFKYKKIASLLVGLVFYSNVCFFYTFANCLKVQQSYVDFRTTLLLSKLNDVCDSNKVYNIAFRGTAGYSDEIKQEMCQYPVIEDLIPEFYTGTGWGHYLFASNNFIIKELEDIPAMPKIYETKYFDIYKDDLNILVYSKSN